MSHTVEGIPQSMTREQYVSLTAGVGLDASKLISLEFRADGIYAVTAWEDADGAARQDFPPSGTVDDEFAIVQNRIFIPVVDA